VPTGQGTGADARLIHRLAQRNVHVTVRKIQGWRRLGIIDSAQVVHRGRRGTEALDYPPGTEDRIEQIVGMLAKHRDMYLVVLGLFGVGVTPSERALRDAYGRFLDKSEADDVRNLTLADSPGPTFSNKVNEFASAMRADVPAMVDRWNEDAKARAATERQYVNADGETAQVSSKDMRQRDAEAWMLARLGDQGGDARPLLRAFGVREERVEGMHLDGGVPSYAECRSALDATEFEKIVAARDLVRDSWQEFVADELPAPLGAFINPLVDTPEAFGLMIAFGVLSALAFVRRDLDEGDGSEPS